MIKIYGKEDCPFCDKAKQLCSSKDIDFSYYQLGVDYSISELMQLVPTARTMPQIFKQYNEDDSAKPDSSLLHIGGYAGLERFIK